MNASLILGAFSSFSLAWALPPIDPTEISQAHQKLLAALDIGLLKTVDGEAVLRLHDGSHRNMVLSTSGNLTTAVMIQSQSSWPTISQEQQAQVLADDIELIPKRYEATFQDDPDLAESVRYLVSRIADFDSNEIGLDGGFLYVEAVSNQRKPISFSIWSPSQDLHPLSFEIFHFFWQFVTFIDMLDPSSNQWETSDAANLSLSFPGISSLKPDRKAAERYVSNALRERLINTARALNDIEQGAAANP